jgi:hypothetical protein
MHNTSSGQSVNERPKTCRNAGLLAAALPLQPSPFIQFRLSTLGVAPKWLSIAKQRA